MGSYIGLQEGIVTMGESPEGLLESIVIMGESPQ